MPLFVRMNTCRIKYSWAKWIPVLIGLVIRIPRNTIDSFSLKEMPRLYFVASFQQGIKFTRTTRKKPNTFLIVKCCYICSCWACLSKLFFRVGGFALMQILPVPLIWPFFRRLCCFHLFRNYHFDFLFLTSSRIQLCFRSLYEIGCRIQSAPFKYIYSLLFALPNQWSAT